MVGNVTKFHDFLQFLIQSC